MCFDFDFLPLSLCLDIVLSVPPVEEITKPCFVFIGDIPLPSQWLQPLGAHHIYIFLCSGDFSVIIHLCEMHFKENYSVDTKEIFENHLSVFYFMSRILSTGIRN